MTDHDGRPIAPLPYRRRTVLRALTIGSIGIGLATVGALPAAASNLGVRELRAGMSGMDVRELQIRIAGWASDDAGHSFLSITGTFDPATEAAVRRFQKAHGLPDKGLVDAPTRDRLSALEAPDGSTAHFEWTQFAAPDGGGFAAGTPDEATVRENARRLMYKLEALRHKVDDREVVVQTGFHSTTYRPNRITPPGGIHTHGTAVDITVPGLTTYAIYRIAQTCGFSGLGSYVQSWLHCDSRAEHHPNASWSWANGSV
ncbi:MAG TPA: M15 family metallopeptidase [Actinophytocola sp.]|uniref:M15 family metallopeptidase n=1 Tax=Actinophytocola sp. TaxID=1872138 RepID=UPI002DB737DD|nr:M15 family metallopeptidase [Actinophytocola sp.]HEU5472926.1 M15 family metallopeptidase [Actinophytocola sp.]